MELQPAGSPELPETAAAGRAEQLPEFKSDQSSSLWTRFANYWRRRNADHRPPPLKKPTNAAGEVLEWRGPAHRKRASSEPEGGQPTKQRRKRNLKLRFFAPQQVKPRDIIVVKVLGKIGWVAKALVYAIIGGQACNSAVGDDSGSISPQGAFILVGSNTIGDGLLVVMGIAIAFYAAWRFWEGITGQGTDAANSKGLNFFRYRLSPIVSGFVYTLYAVFVLTLLPKDTENKQTQAKNSSFPDSWAHSTIGKVGLALAGIAFVAAFLVQLEGALTKNFHETLKPKDQVPRWLWWITLVSGHIGFLARGAVFMAVGILFFREIKNSGGAGGETAIGDALSVFESSKGGEAGLFILGTGLIVYGLFATLNGLYVREFPTRVPSGVPMGYLPRVLQRMSVKNLDVPPPEAGAEPEGEAGQAPFQDPGGDHQVIQVKPVDDDVIQDGEGIKAAGSHRGHSGQPNGHAHAPPGVYDLEAQSPVPDSPVVALRQAAAANVLSTKEAIARVSADVEGSPGGLEGKCSPSALKDSKATV